MRKADYFALAEIIRARLHPASTAHLDPQARAAHVAALESVARTFAYRASVDNAAFLKLCGLPSIAPVT